MRSSGQRAHSSRRQQHQSRPHRAEAAIALALVELALRQLDVARREVVDDRDARQPRRQVVRAHLRAGRQIPAQHQAELDLVVEQAHVRRAGDRRIGRGDARRRLREDRVEGKVLDAQAGLLHVAAVVHALADELLVRSSPARAAARCRGGAWPVRARSTRCAPSGASAARRCWRHRRAAGRCTCPNCTPQWDVPLAV